MSKNKIGLWVLLTLGLAISTASADMWYGADGPVPLRIDSLKVTIKIEDGFLIQQVLAAVDRVAAVVDDKHLVDGFIACSLSTGADYDAFLDSLDTLDGVYLVEPYYLSENGFPHLVGEGICVKFHDYVTYEEIDSINAMYKVVIDRERIGRQKAFTLKNTDSTGYRVVELANIYHNLPQVEYAHPDFSAAIEKYTYGLYDYYNQYQPHLKKVIGEFNVASVWDFAGLGRTITVAVIDDGVDSHEDLPSTRILPGYDFAGDAYPFNPDNDPRPGDSCAHGMAVAGILAASHTTDPAFGKFSWTGVISMNTHINVMPVKIFNSTYCNMEGVSISELSDAIDSAWTQGSHILSNSWGFENPFQSDYPDLNQALERATVFGRNGLGCPVIFASGNNYNQYIPRWVRYPARLPFCFAVGATRLDDSLWDYSCYGPGQELDMVAPSGNVGLLGDVWTHDQMGILGYNPTYMSDCPDLNNDVDYNCKFGGTSAACPVVSGTASLILSKDSTLTVDEVYNILDSSAVTDLDWGPLPDTPSVEYGYGRVDAFRAILSLSHGNVDNDALGQINVGDLTYLVDFLWRGGPAPFPSLLLGDCDCDRYVNLGDVTYLIAYLFQEGPPPPKPCFAF